MILPREWETLSNFASHPIGTGPYAVIRNSTNQLKIQAFDDFFGYRALIDEVNVWVLPEIADEPAGGLMLKGPQGEEKEIESRLEEGCYYLLFGQPHPSRGESASQRLGKLCAFSDESGLFLLRNSTSNCGSRLMDCSPVGTMPAP